MVDLRRFLDGYTIRWDRVGLAVVGAGIYAYLQGAAAVLLSLADLPIALLSGLANFLGTLVETAVALPAVIITRGWQAAAQVVLDAGIAGFLVAISIVLVTLYVVALVVNEVTG